MIAHRHELALLGLDIGTTSCKVICYTADGAHVAQASTRYQLAHPKPGWAELDPDDVIAAVEQVLTHLAPHVDGFDRLALAISAQGEAVILVDREGRALTPIPVSMDMRGLEAIAAMRRDSAAVKAAESAGQDLNPLTSLAKLLWFRDAPGQPLARTDKALCVGEFVMAHLGLRPVMDHSMAARMGLLDIQAKTWSRDLLEAAGLSPDLLPALAPSGSYVGTVPAERMASLGLDRDVEVYVGGHDQACAMLGAGVTDGSTALYSIGTTEAIAVPTDEITGDLAELHIVPYPHVVNGKSVLLFGSQHGGRVLPWLARLTGRDGGEAIPHDLPSTPSALTVVPHLAGTGSILADDEARATIHGLDYDTTPQSLTLAALEGVTMEQALGLSRLAAGGLRITGLRAVGGGTRSDIWMQIKADVLALPIDCLAEPDTACAGAAALAGQGAGAFQCAEDAAARMVAVRQRFAPRPELREIYELKRELYGRTYMATAGLQPLRKALDRAVAELRREPEGSE